MKNTRLIDILPTFTGIVAIIDWAVIAQSNPVNPGYVLPGMLFGGAVATAIAAFASTLTAGKRHVQVLIQVLNFGLFVAAVLFLWLTLVGGPRPGA